MSDQELLQQAETIEARLDGANQSLRLELQPKLSKVIANLRANGTHVPARLKQLDAALCDEAIEARFDNMPI
ncbi:hypothetical protein [Falsiruegeria mediterranea]|jgi:hypothetical protein|uniref:Uncharacterized protein n=1 Tax=Falsiruegeria mediterranea M17 TaxID=1200281 RepID=A0A2R8C7V3_9RHOB|nr:hypothetical protein [Falsiruegeria mediterranea]SPJ28478.1 hypothetical protein TRM7615_01977 [Falsiruegeria mediterranea M17]